jgi:hypothetical protein
MKQRPEKQSVLAAQASPPSALPALPGWQAAVKAVCVLFCETKHAWPEAQASSLVQDAPGAVQTLA